MPRLPAAIVYRPGDDIDALMASVITHLQRQGVRLGGVIQHNFALKEGCAEDMELQDLMNGERFSLCQALGTGSEACRLDPHALARAAMAARNAVEAGVDLVVFNKFGAREAAGEGLRDEMALSVVHDIPLLTAVGERFLEDWVTFTGGENTALPCELEAVLAWWQRGV